MCLHHNTIASHDQLKGEKITSRILAAYSEAVLPFTDRQMAEHLGYEDLNIVRPKITALIRAGFCKEVGSVYDQKTERMVRQVTNGEGERQPRRKDSAALTIQSLEQAIKRLEAKICNDAIEIDQLKARLGIPKPASQDEIDALFQLGA